MDTHFQVIRDAIRNNVTVVRNISAFTGSSLQQKREALEKAAVFATHAEVFITQTTHTFLATNSIKWQQMVVLHLIRLDLQTLKQALKEMGILLFPEWFPDFFSARQITELHRQFDKQQNEFAQI